MHSGDISTLDHAHLLALTAVSEAVHRSLDLGKVLDEALDQALTVLQLDAGDIRLLRRDHLELVASRGLSVEFLEAESSVPLGRCNCGNAAHTGELILIEDLGRRPDLPLVSCRWEQFASVISLPVGTTDRVVGLIHAASRESRTFDSYERVLLTAIGYQVGMAIEKAQLYARLRELATELEARVQERTIQARRAQEALADKAEQLNQMLEGERRIEERTRARVAHDLHDGVQQLIIGSLFELEAAREVALTHPQICADRCAAAQDILHQLELEMRSAIYNLRPVALDAHGLAPALRECVEAFQRTTGVSCALHVTGAPQRFHPDAEIVAFRIVQEALNNAEAHAHASRLDVYLGFGDGAVVVCVKDNGIGFDLEGVDRQPRSHLGLIGMRQRAEGVGGDLEVWSAPHCGTRITLALPTASLVTETPEAYRAPQTLAVGDTGHEGAASR